VQKATALPGIGPWTAHYMALRAMGLPDAFPAGDLVLQQVLGEGQRLSERETERRSQPWRPWRAYACCTCGTWPPNPTRNRRMTLYDRFDSPIGP
jgi:AraC family transcriptional regulator of adaptative response / DNA-3-methyladenine glycosylase II